MNPSQLIDKQIADLGDWRGTLASRVRQLIHEAVPDIAEEWKWDTGVWTHNGMVCAIGVFKDHIKVNFFKGAVLADPEKLFNAGLEAKKSRAIDLFEGQTLNETAFKELVQSAAALNKK